MPPRHMKSISVSVMFPAWVWLNDAGEKFLYASHSAVLTVRDCVQSRYIIRSNLYESYIRKDPFTGLPEWKLSDDQDQKTRYTNTMRGQRVAISVGAKVGTGEGGDFVIQDDPNNTMEAESKTKIESTNLWYDTVYSSRTNDENSVEILLQQRSNEKDMTGHILSKELPGVETLILPARYEMENRIKTSLTGWIDIRTKKNEPLWKEHKGDEALKIIEKKLASPYIIAGQMQQRPAPKKGGMFKRKDLEENIVSQAYFDHLNQTKQLKRTVRYWDKAGTEDGGCNTAGVCISETIDGRFFISDSVKGQWAYSKREKRIKRKAEQDKVEFKKYKVWVEQEPGSGGLESAQRTIKNLPGISAGRDKPVGDKVLRAGPLETQVDIQNVFIVKGDWNVSFIDEMVLFPKGEFKDQVDSAAAGYLMLTKTRKRAGVR